MTSPAEWAHRDTQASRLRAVLADYRWHTGRELARRVGWRFSAALLIVRRGEDGDAPWEVQAERLTSDGSQWRYRLVQELPAAARRRRTPGTLAALRREIGRLRAVLRKAGLSAEVEP